MRNSAVATTARLKPAGVRANFVAGDTSPALQRHARRNEKPRRGRNWPAIFDMHYPQVCISSNTIVLDTDQTKIKQTSNKQMKANKQLHTSIAASQRSIFGHSFHIRQ
jgi:hypothetical protein